METAPRLQGLRRRILHCSVLLAALSASGGMALAATPAASTAPAAGQSRVLVVGDSLSAEYGLARGSGWVALLGQRVAAEKLPFEVVNASISGDTTAGGRSRLPALLKQYQPKVLVIELGGNDALRGLPLASTRDNLTAMALAGKAAGAKLLLIGMQVPPNYGAQYTRDFADVFSSTAQAQKAALVPFLLVGIADRPDAEQLFQPDRIHPKAEAHPRMLDNVWPVLKPLLR
ncbi:arylesterase [Ideonella azotifigens]|uniref:Arylesterase n=2 Tax=Ideonella azotifigens TaxID=513160 RepID=A0ABN1KD62_9BURK